MKREQLDLILEKHKKWLEGDGGERADLIYADLSYADLSDAKLSDANLRSADLSYANLRFADLSCANLSGADLSGADLKHANLSGANLSDADLSYANLSDTKLSPKEHYRLGEILDKKIIGYKKLQHDIIATLEIPKNAIVFGINGVKFRTNKAKCIGLSKESVIGYSTYDETFSYEVGKKYTIKDFNLTYNIECASGIHFFKTKEEAEQY